jgi:hypothetical protein
LKQKQKRFLDNNAMGRSMKWNTIKMGKKVESFVVLFERDPITRAGIDKSLAQFAPEFSKKSKQMADYNK